MLTSSLFQLFSLSLPNLTNKYKKELANHLEPHLAPHIHPAKLLACCKIFCKPHISSCTRVKNVTFSLSLVPHCHLIIACPFTCHPHVSNTSACKKLTITCLLSSLHFSSLPLKEQLEVKRHFCSKIWPSLVVQKLTLSFVQLSICLPPTSFIPHLSIYLLLSAACFYSSKSENGS